MTAPHDAAAVAAIAKVRRLSKMQPYRCPHCRNPKSAPMGMCGQCFRFGEARTYEQIAADDAHWKAGKLGPLPSARAHLQSERPTDAG